MSVPLSISKRLTDAELIMGYLVSSGVAVSADSAAIIARVRDAVANGHISSGDEASFYETYGILSKQALPVTAASLRACSDEYGVEIKSWWGPWLAKFRGSSAPSSTSGTSGGSAKKTSQAEAEPLKERTLETVGNSKKISQAKVTVWKHHRRGLFALVVLLLVQVYWVLGAKLISLENTAAEQKTPTEQKKPTEQNDGRGEDGC